MHQIQLLAGTLCSLIFMTATFPMLMKAWHTKDMTSYSLLNIGLNNAGNLLYWLYVISLPIGPIWFLHGFNTVVTLIMLVWCLIYRAEKQIQQHFSADMKRETIIFAPIRSKHPTAS